MSVMIKSAFPVGIGNAVRCGKIEKVFRAMLKKLKPEAAFEGLLFSAALTYDTFAHLPIYGLEYLGFVPRGEAGRFIAERNTAHSGALLLQANALSKR